MLTTIGETRKIKSFLVGLFCTYNICYPPLQQDLLVIESERGMRWSKVRARACLFKAPGCSSNSFTHSEGTSLPRWNEQKRKGGKKVEEKKVSAQLGLCKKRCGRGWQACHPDWGLISPVGRGFTSRGTLLLLHLQFHLAGTFLLLEFYLEVPCYFETSSFS